MRFTCLIFLAFGIGASRAPAQKAVIDTTVFGRWPEVKNLAFSPDGRYYAYSIEYKVSPDAPVHSQTWILQEAGGSWKREFRGIAPGVFTADSRAAVVRIPQDSLCLVPLGREGLTCLPRIRSFTLLTRPTGEWLVYQPTTPGPAVGIRNLATGQGTVYPGVTAYTLTPAGTAWLFVDTTARTLTIQSVKTGRSRIYANVERHWLSSDGAAVVLLTGAAEGAARRAELMWVDVASGAARSIWAGETPAAQAASVIFDETNTRLAFLVTDPGRQPADHGIWYYESGSPRAVRVADDRSVGLEGGWHLDATGHWWRFSHDGRRLMVTVAPPPVPPPNPGLARVTIRSYADGRLPTDPHGSRYAILDLKDRRLLPLANRADLLGWVSNAHGEFAWVGKRELEEQWARVDPLSLVSTETGARTPLGLLRPEFWASRGRYLLWRDSLLDISATDLTTGVTRNLTRGGPYQVVDAQDSRDGGRYPRVSVVAWLENEQAILVQDRYDLWQIDPVGHRPPVNLTNGYGRKHRTVFRLPGTSSGALETEWMRTPVKPRGALVLTAFDLTTKESGFYRVTWGRAADPERLSLGPYRYTETSRYPVGKGASAAYVVRRESATESPNYFATRDFRTFTPLTSVYPERAYRWLRAELTAWTSREGRRLQGIIYKPEDFDPRRKYPAIFLHYETLSDELHHYRKPEPMWAWINVPWFLSRGYIVVFPDIVNTIGWPGRSALHALESAAEHLASFPWVDAEHMGIFGHSFGGFRTNYVVTRTGRFAAAVSASGWVDLVDRYNREEGNQNWFEGGQGGIYATLWERPDLYLENSAIMCADRVTTPLLLNANPGDSPVSYSQGLAWFRALRRLGKRAWLLQYDGSGHLLNGAAAQVDYTLRVTQFFDHYLKGAPAPTWMTEGPGVVGRPTGLWGRHELAPKPSADGLAMCQN